MILFTPAIHKRPEPLPDEMSCLFWPVGHKYDELTACFGLLAMTMSCCLFWALGHEHDELLGVLVRGSWALGNELELIVWGSWALGNWP